MNKAFPPRFLAAARAYRARAYYVAGSAKKAFREFRKALAIHPTSAVAHNLHGICLYEDGREKEAYQMLEKGVEMDLGYADSYYYLGEILRNNNRRRAAAKHFKIYLDARPDGSHASEARKGLRATE